MKNLKRALSFALASVMLIGMMVVGAGAAIEDFDDAEKIVNTEAVETLVALNVIAGKEDGSWFDPEGTVSRAEMAKMITVSLHGGKEPVIGTQSTPTYTDIKGTWAESYIEYCSNLGIIAGRGDGTFDPTAPVTGTEAAKMMLVAMGWESTIFGFTGSSWALNVNTEANRVKLYEGLEHIDPSASLSRDDAALLIYNGILAPIMLKSPNMTVTNGEITWDYTLQDGISSTSKQTLFSTKYDGLVYIATFDGDSNVLSGLEEGYIQVTGQLDTQQKGSSTTAAASFPYEYNLSEIGEEVRVLFKDGKGGAYQDPDVKDTIYGVFNTGVTRVINTTRADVKAGSSAAKKADELKIGTITYKLATPAAIGDLLVMDDYGADAGATASGGSAAALLASAKAAFEGLYVPQNGSTIKFVCDENGRITRAYVVDTSISYVTAVTAGKVTLYGVGSIELADNEVYEGIALNDVVNYTKFYDADKDDAFFTVTKAEEVAGTMTGYKAGYNVVIDGVTLKLVNCDNGTVGASALTQVIIDGETSKANGAVTFIDEEFVAYMVNGYVGYLFQNTKSINYAVVIEANDGTVNVNFGDAQAVLLLADGTKVTAKISDKSVLKVNAADFGDTTAWDKTEKAEDVLAPGQLVEYYVDGDGKYVLTEVGTYAKDSANAYDEDTKSFRGKLADDDAVLFTYEWDDTEKKADWKVYDLRSLSDITGAFDSESPDFGSAYYDGYVTNSDDKTVAAFVTLVTRPAGASANTFYGIVTAYVGIREIDGIEYRYYTVANETETVDVYTPKTYSLTKGNLVKFDKASDNIYTTSTLTQLTNGKHATNTSGAAWIKEFNQAAKTVTVWTSVSYNSDANIYEGANSVTYALGDNFTIAYVDQDGDKGGSESGVVPFNAQTGFENAMLVIHPMNNEVDAIIMETSGDANVIGKTGKGAAVLNDADGTLAAADLTAADDGIYLPDSTITTWTFAGDMGAADPDDVVIIKFTTVSGNTYNLEIKDAAGNVVRSESLVADTTAEWFYGNLTTNWSALTTGTYTVTVKTGTTTVFSGYLTV